MICDQTSLSNLDDKCIRRVWRALLPSIVLTSIFLCALVAFIFHTPVVSSRIYSWKWLRRIRRSLRPFLDLHQAEDLLASSSREQGTPLPYTTLPNTHHDILKDSPAGRRAVERWSTKFHAVRLAVPLFLGSLLETLAWLTIACYEIASSSAADPSHSPNPGPRPHTSSSVAAFAIASVWAYISLRVAFSPSIRVHARPPPDILILLLTLGTAATIDGAGRVYETYVYDRNWVPFRSMGWWLVDMGLVSALIWVIIVTPLELPGERVNAEEIGHEVSPEDYTSIWGWMSFSFVTPLIKKGTANTLNEDDVWEVSPHHRAGPLLSRYMSVKGKTLLRKLWTVNSLDLIMDALLTLVAALFNYAGPFFLKQILEAIDNPSREARARAYVYALFTFLASLIKTQADMHHLWYGRQAVTRTRSLLMAAVYDKALKRKDFSGAVAASTSVKASGGLRKISIKSAVLEQVGKGKNKSGSRASAGADIGKVVNLMSGDASKVSQIFGNVYNLYGAPFEIIIASVFLYQLLGYSAFLGFFTLILFTPLNHKLSTRRIFISRGISTARDRRMAVLNELFVSVKFIKLCAWDERWINRAERAREKELKWIGRERWNTIWLGFLWTAAPILVSVVSFAVFVVIEKRKLTIAIAFTSIVLFNQLRQPLNVLPNFMAQILQARVALERLSAFFSEEEVDSFVSTLKQPPPTAPPNSISIELPTLGITGGARFVWNSVERPDPNPKITVVAPAANGSERAESPVDERRFELKDIDIIFPQGKMTLVTGATASGKTALLMALLGEMTPSLPSRAQVHLPKSPYSALDEYGLRSTVSYAAQTPWLEHLSIRENILFGSPFEEERYWEVIECCALGLDLTMLEDGDATEIGERGISLSGGQKARVALARAVYARSRCVLLDDPLSAVDSHTARFLFERLFQGGLLKHRTVVLVTHHIELVLPGAYYLVHMVDGEIVNQGTVADLRTTGFLDRVASLAPEKDRRGNCHGSTSDSSEDGVTGDDEGSSNSDEDTGSVAKNVHDIIEQLRAKDRERQGRTGRKLVQEEARQTGNVKWEIYDTYFKASSYLTWVVILVLIVISQLFGFFEKFWLKVWGEAYNTVAFGVSDLLHSESQQLAFQEISSPPPYLHALLVNPNILGTDPSPLSFVYRDALPYVLIYAAIGLAGVVITTINTVVQYHGAIRASKSLFTRLLNTLVHATMRWHDVTPTGRILNRLSRDMEVLDSSLSNSLRAVLFRLATFIASIATVAYVFPIFLIPACVISFFYYQISKGYVNAGRDMRRMQSTTRSPIFAGFAETLEGIVTVRAFSAERRFIGTLVQRVDLSTKMWYGFWMLNRWLLLRFDGLGALSIFVITIFALAGYVSGGWAGITITSAMQFTVSVYWTCRFATQLELDLNSVERVVEYLDLPQEPPNKVAGKEVPAAWPSITTVGPAGTPEKPFITVENLTIRYSPELPPVLHGVSFELKAGEKIGLLGRTGSGKSTLAMSLLRFTDPSAGRIIIDGMDICEIGLGDLRSKLTIIPQDSVLFSGTLRENLDPFEEHSDADCLDALFRVHLLNPTIPSNATATIRKSRRTDVAQLLFDRPQTPEPESISVSQPDLSGLTRKLSNPLKRRARHLYASETLMVPAIGHTGGTVTPVHMEGDREVSPDDGEMSERERDGVHQMYQTSTQSGIASPIPTRRRRFSGSDLSPIADSGEESGTNSRRGSIAPEGSGVANRPGPGSVGGGMLSLETRVASGGANFSNGQRQLVSMARALLRRNAVVILDEATSSIDFETDAKIQATVRQEFRASCLITIAHRIRTVIDYDRLIVLDKGRIVEFDTPWNLIQEEGGLFRDMCMNSGMMDELQSLAKAKLMGSGTW